MKQQGHRSAVLVVFAVVALLLGGCATSGQQADPTDPLEGLNRGLYGFNSGLDRALIGPIASAYVAVTPEPVRIGVTNFFQNVAYPGVVLNDLLQGKFEQAVEDTGHFLINSTLGIFGLIDLATPLGMDRHKEDFGQTLGVWGAGEGAYLVLPALGPNSMRDAPGVVVGALTNVLWWVADSSLLWPLAGLRAVDTRARLDAAIKLRERSAIDPYVFTREAYRQHRTHLIYDGNPPLEDFDELEEQSAKLGKL